jgi:hypothetical protein
MLIIFPMMIIQMILQMMIIQMILQMILPMMKKRLNLNQNIYDNLKDIPIKYFHPIWNKKLTNFIKNNYNFFIHNKTKYMINKIIIIY